MRYRLYFPMMVGMALIAIPAFAESFVNQAEQLATLRAEVTKLANTLRDDQTQFQNRLRSLETQRSDLELQLRRDRSQLDSVNAQIADLERELLPSVQQEQLKAVVFEMSEKLRASVQKSLPYRHQDRLAAIDEITADLQSNSLSAQQAATRLWAVAEDERRLNQENILDNQQITVNGETLLVDTARLGMVAMYYQQPNGNVGYAQRQADSWIWVPITDATQQEQVQQLLLNLKKGIRTGVYNLPNAMVQQ